MIILKNVKKSTTLRPKAIFKDSIFFTQEVII